eukprot:scaffold63880_cov78-Phaeocystis_antarctica.AAC.1
MNNFAEGQGQRWQEGAARTKSVYKDAMQEQERGVHSSSRVHVGGVKVRRSSMSVSKCKRVKGQF